MAVFILNREKVPRHVLSSPNLTVLEYLRAQGLPGTKEGCASGDCGACAVAVAKDNGHGKLHYDAVNSCICQLASLHARHIITVEGLADGDKLHPVQQSMVECHGSQCGFCTPGFVMSLFVHRKNNGEASHEALTERLSGNLCRCTGYRPILDAGRMMSGSRHQDWFDKQSKHTVAMLQKLQKKTPDNIPHHIVPRTIEQLAKVLANNRQARIVAGGTDIMLEVTQQLQQFTGTVYVGDIAAMSKIHETRSHWIVGAAATYVDVMNTIATHPQMRDLQNILRRFGSPQIRARATVGGNIANASPVADGPPAWLALGAILKLRRGQSVRQLPLEKFYQGYKKTALRSGEFIESIAIAKPTPSEEFRMYKVSKRMDDDISSVCAAFKFSEVNGKIHAPRVAFGGMAAYPIRALKCEQKWVGCSRQQGVDSLKSAIGALSKEFSPISDVRAGADYRRIVATRLLQKAHTGIQPSLLAEVSAS